MSFVATSKRIAVAAVLLLAGCVHPGRVPRPTITGAKLPSEAAQEFLASAKSDDESLRSLRELSHTTMSHGKDNFYFRHAIVFQRPGDLRIETLPTQAAYTLNLLAVRDGNFVFLDASKKEYRKGSSSNALHEILSLPLGPEEFMSLVTGRVPSRFTGDAQGEPLSVFEGDKRVELVSQDFSFYASLDSGSKTALMVEYRNPEKDEVVLRLTYDRYEDVGGRKLPAKVDVWIPEHDVHIKMDIAVSSVNKPPPEALFTPEIPSDYSQG